MASARATQRLDGLQALQRLHRYNSPIAQIHVKYCTYGSIDPPRASPPAGPLQAAEAKVQSRPVFWIDSNITSHNFEFYSYGLVPHVKALSLNWSTTSTVGTIDPLCIFIYILITGLAPLDTTWCTASGSPIKPEGLQCISHCVVPCTHLLIMHCVISSFGNICSLCLSIRPLTMDLETIYDTRRDTTEDEPTVTDRAIVDHVRGLSHAALGCTHL